MDNKQIARIQQSFADSIRTKQQCVEPLAAPISRAADVISRALQHGAKVLCTSMCPPDTDVEVKNLESGARAHFRVVWIADHEADGVDVVGEVTPPLSS